MNTERKLRSMDDILLDGKVVLMRVDFNVALNSAGRVGADEDYRLEASLPTLQELLQKRCKVILLTHLGRPGEKGENFDLAPIKHRLEELLQEDVKQTQDLFGPEVNSIVAGVEAGSAVLLPNVRLDAREMSPNEKFGRELAKVAEVFINEAFSASHRDQTSITVLPQLLPSCAGRRTVMEYETMMQLLRRPDRPYVAITSGAKVDTKVQLLNNLLETVDYICLAGMIANVFLLSQGRYLSNHYSSQDLAEAAKLLAKGRDKIILPDDVVVSRGGQSEIMLVKDIPPDIDGIWDVGPQTVKKFLDYCGRARTILWNGPLGKCEEKPFNRGTEDLAAGLAESDALTVVGGGDTVNVLERMHLLDRFSHVSVGGGAMLTMLEGGKMPGLEPLYDGAN